MAKNKLIKFNIKNVKYAIKNDLGEYGEPKDLAYANSLSLEADYNEQKIFGDGQIIGILADDKGKTGTLSVLNVEQEYEVDCKRARLIDGGLADIQQHASIEHAIYYEVDAIQDGVPITIKNWLFGCITGKANETYQQTQDDPTVNYYEYPLTVMGTTLQDSTGTKDYVDANGNTYKVTRLTAFPTDTGFATFGDTVPIPKEKVAG